ncbi:MAG: succinate dehydrogenase/fumarate reductase cytochrome b subunit [Paludibacteraceae bacterium]|nr:succinate dehydrogenase/fumarate reductase cytochrome b subunit [Paludibacteraceae bacterium]
MWLTDSSIGRKLVMSISGVALVLFLLFHATMNIFSITDALFGVEYYNAICKFLGANWYALIATLGLAFLVVVHIAYAFFLEVQNYRARGRQRYAIEGKQPAVEWSSKNMLALGVVILLGIGLHLFNFWGKMQFVEIQHIFGIHVCETALANATNGVLIIKDTFANPIYVVLYLVWLGAIWFHLTHGVWSALHTMGLNNDTWMSRVKCISNIVATLVVLMFAAVVVFYFGVSLAA